MTLPTAAPAPTIPARKPTSQWHVGEIVTTTTGARWLIVALNTRTRQTVLKCMNRVASGLWWDTTLNHLPEKNA